MQTVMNKVAKQPQPKIFAIGVIAAMVGMSFSAHAEKTTDVVNQALIEDSSLKLQWRARYERVDVDGVDNQDLTSLRTRLTYQSGDLYDFFVGTEIDDVQASDQEAMIADYSYTQINQAYLGFKAPNKTLIKYGRQRILLDNQRFVGGVGFRQNEQTYSGVTISNQYWDGFKAYYAYVNQVHRIFAEDSGKAEHHNETSLLNVSYSKFKPAQVTAYAYLIDNQQVKRFSTDTYGLRVQGKVDLTDSGFAGLNFGYVAEFASQKAGSNNELDYTANYYHVKANGKYQGIGVVLGYEVLGSDSGIAGFVTPLATLHKFQGWTDKFLFGGAGNWDNGIQDLYVGLSGSFQGISGKLVYHDFKADEGDIDMGSEWGVSLGYQFTKRYSAEFKYAAFSNADTGYAFSSDTDKLWLSFMANFG